MPEARILSIRNLPLKWDSTADPFFFSIIAQQHEPLVYDFVDSLSSEETLFDIGASGGRIAIYAAAKGITTHAFEPELANYDLLASNKQLNDLQNLFIYKLAMSNKDGPGKLVKTNSRPGIPGKVLAGLQKYDLSEDIAQTTLDTFCEQHKVIPTAIKVDIDGAEYRFLLGASKILANPLVRNLIIELRQMVQYQPCMDLIKGHGFRHYKEEEIAPGLYNKWYRREA